MLKNPLKFALQDTQIISDQSVLEEGSLLETNQVIQSNAWIDYGRLSNHGLFINVNIMRIMLKMISFMIYSI